MTVVRATQQLSGKWQFLDCQNSLTHEPIDFEFDVSDQASNDKCMSGGEGQVIELSGRSSAERAIGRQGGGVWGVIWCGGCAPSSEKFFISFLGMVHFAWNLMHV